MLFASMPAASPAAAASVIASPVVKAPAVAASVGAASVGAQVEDDGLRPVDGVRGVWRAAPGWAEALLDADGPPLLRWAEEGRLTAVKRSPHRTVWRLQLEPGSDGEPRTAFLKIAAGGRGGGGRTLIDPARPFREARAAARVAAAGVATAAPLLAGRFAWTTPPPSLDGFVAGGPLTRGPVRALITASVEPAVPLPDVLNGLDRLAPSLRRAVTVAVAAATAKLHAAGLFPGDLHPGNLFLRGLKATADGGFVQRDALEPVLIDVIPLSVRRGGRGRRGRIARSLGMLAHGAGLFSSKTDRLRFLAVHHAAVEQAIGGETGGETTTALGPWRGWTADAEAARDAESRRRHARRDRHWRRGCRGMRMLDARTRCVDSVSDDEAARLLALSGDGGTGGGTSGGRAAMGGRAVRIVRLSPAAVRAGWETGHALLRRGVPVAEPLLCREERHAGTLILAAGPPLAVRSDDQAAVRRRCERLCERLRAWGYTIDGPRAEDFSRDADGAVCVANPADVRPAGRDEPVPAPTFARLASPAPALRRAA